MFSGDPASRQHALQCRSRPTDSRDDRDLHRSTLNLLRTGLVVALLVTCSDAWGLRCSNRLVTEGMTEDRVIELCGEPESVRHLGYVLRPYIMRVPVSSVGSRATRRVYSGFHQELAVKELLFNFGPQRLMRVMRFEGGLLTSIDTAGYGHREQDP